MLTRICKQTTNIGVVISRFLTTKRQHIKQRWQQQSKSSRYITIAVVTSVYIFAFYQAVIGELMSHTIISIVITTSLILLFSEDEKFGHLYVDDPFNALSINDKTIVLKDVSIEKDRIKKIALSELEDMRYLSFPYNQINGEAPTLYFDKGHVFYVRKFLLKHLVNVEFIE